MARKGQGQPGLTHHPYQGQRDQDSSSHHNPGCGKGANQRFRNELLCWEEIEASVYVSIH